ncbi:PilT protein, N-terminal [Leptolyngbya sp. NIES-2104]|nr:PilT protein, N-terminal [Leptolyngbya sp. NIES-2104]
MDTNVILRFANTLDVNHSLVTSAIRKLLDQNNECVITSQVIIEFWVVATRPTNVNGFGWSVEQVKASVDRLLDRFPLLEDCPEIFPIWLELVSISSLKGKRIHDIRLVAVMLAYGVNHLLTLNPSDFAVTSFITVVHPQMVQ